MAGSVDSLVFISKLVESQPVTRVQIRGNHQEDLERILTLRFVLIHWEY